MEIESLGNLSASIKLRLTCLLLLTVEFLVFHPKVGYYGGFIEEIQLTWLEWFWSFHFVNLDYFICHNQGHRKTTQTELVKFEVKPMNKKYSINSWQVDKILKAVIDVALTSAPPPSLPYFETALCRKMKKTETRIEEKISEASRGQWQVIRISSRRLLLLPYSSTLLDGFCLLLAAKHKKEPKLQDEWHK